MVKTDSTKAKQTTKRTTRPSYSPEPAPLSKLPFVKRDGKKADRSNWDVQPTDYRSACRKGEEYAAHLAIYLKDNPFWVGSGIIGSILEDMDFTDGSGTAESGKKGYAIGFCAFLEKMLYHYSSQNDVWAHFEHKQKQ